MKNRKVVLGVGILVSLVLLASAYYLFSSKKSQQASINQSEIQEEVAPTIKPEELGLKLTARADKKAVKFSIDNPKDITLVEYEITYLAKGEIPRGVIGSLEPKDTGSLESKFIDLGSCSSGKCKYDEGVTSVKFLLKITKKDGKTYQTQQSLPL